MPNGRLLILDDEPSIGETFTYIGEDAGFECRATTSPAEFFAAVDSWAPTHIAVDLIMPEMDGVEVLRLLAERRCEAMVVITSGVGSRVLDAARRTAAESGLRIAGVLGKPFTMDEVKAFLARRSGPVPKPRVPVRDQAEPTEEELRSGLDHGELVLAFQPKVRCEDGALAGFEALVRWDHGGTIIYPDRFIPLAERTGLIDQLTEVVLRDAVRWLATHFTDAQLAMSVNISARSLSAHELGDRIFDECRAHGLDPARLILEVTESSAMQDPLRSLELLTRLRVRGFHLSIDDFGTGFSSMVQLVRLPFSEVKVDKSFVMELGRSQESRAVVRSIVDLAASLGLRSTAEGVEDAEALAYLREVGCTLAQGYFIARPMFSEAALAWAREWKGLA